MRVIGHRGATVQAPENTIAAMRAAVEAGAAGVEFDVRLSIDGHPVVMHDDELARMTGAAGTVSGSSFAALRALRVGSLGETIPTIDEVLGIVGRMDVVLCELKSVQAADGTYGARVVLDAIVDRVRGIDGLMLTSFDPVTLVAAHELLPGVPTALACYRIPDDDWMLPLAAADGHLAVSIPADQADAEFVGAAHRQGTQVFAFAAPAGEARAFRDLGVDAIITSDPVLALRTLG